MISLYDQEEFDTSNITNKFPCECEICSSIFYKSKRDILKVLNGQRTGKYCSKTCKSIGRTTKKEVVCINCGTLFYKIPSQIHKNNFCSNSCAATYNNKHKTNGNRRSKLERFLEDQLKLLYPELKILFNHKDAINSELDIYIPSLKLAFELNGVFHYEPIYGQDKLNQIQNNDNRKFQACIEKDINLCIIDTSKQKYFKIETSQKYLDIIINIIKERSSTI
ncbi:MAG: hypothetical protein WC428_01435 [Candidatus Paceibacterota bacterium]|jgi:hypothetical protein